MAASRWITANEVRGDWRWPPPAVPLASQAVPPVAADPSSASRRAAVLAVAGCATGPRPTLEKPAGASSDLGGAPGTPSGDAGADGVLSLLEGTDGATFTATYHITRKLGPQETDATVVQAGDTRSITVGDVRFLHTTQDRDLLAVVGCLRAGHARRPHQRLQRRLRVLGRRPGAGVTGGDDPPQRAAGGQHPGRGRPERPVRRRAGRRRGRALLRHAARPGRPVGHRRRRRRAHRPEPHAATPHSALGTDRSDGGRRGQSSKPTTPGSRCTPSEFSVNADQVVVPDHHRHLDELLGVVAVGQRRPGGVGDAAVVVQLVGRPQQDGVERLPAGVVGAGLDPLDLVVGDAAARAMRTCWPHS